MEALREIASWLLLGAGAGFCVVGGIGLLRLPEFYTRMHGAGLIDTLLMGETSFEILTPLSRKLEQVG